MALILHIETSTTVCSVALARDGVVLSNREENKDYSHSAVISSFITQCLDDGNIHYPNLDAIAVSKGPGSYTGLRIGVATAKGICFATGKPLLAINTLQAMAAHFQFLHPGITDALLCPMIDARRMEVYTALFNSKLDFIEETNARIISNNSFSSRLDTTKIIFFGDGMAKCRDLLQHPNAIFIENQFPSASGMIHLAEKSYNSQKFEDIAYFEPYYLKDFLGPRQPLKP